MRMPYHFGSFYYRTIGRDERAYRSFVPTPLQDIHPQIRKILMRERMISLYR